MKRTRVKICGITKLDDALASIEQGADALGFVFCEKSPRNISIKKAQEIIAKLPPFVTTIALFMDESKAFVDNVLKHVPIMCLQFHGVESETFCNQFSCPYIKAVAMGSKNDLVELEKQYHSAQALLLDSNEIGKIGGSGKTFDWDNSLVTTKPYILAGGLNSSNIQGALKALNPYAVDISSGVEKNKGSKDKELIKEFMKKIYERQY